MQTGESFEQAKVFKAHAVPQHQRRVLEGCVAEPLHGHLVRVRVELLASACCAARCTQ